MVIFSIFRNVIIGSFIVELLSAFAVLFSLCLIDTEGLSID